MLEKYFSKPFPLVLHFFLPPRQDIASLAYPDGFRQAQADWLCKTRQDGLTGPSLCSKKSFRFVPCLENITGYEEVAFDAARFFISPVFFQREKCLLISRISSVSFVQ